MVEGDEEIKVKQCKKDVSKYIREISENNLKGYLRQDNQHIKPVLLLLTMKKEE